MVPKVARANVIGGPRRVPACRNHEAVHDLDVGSFEVPTKIEWLKPEIGKAATAGRCAEIGKLRIRNVGH